MISPSSFAVFALKFLQKSMILRPCGPSAVPTGGAGVAFPAAIWSFTIACIFLPYLVLPPSRLKPRYRVRTICELPPAGRKTSRYSFSTCRKSSSTGVDRPKIVTITLSVLRSRFTSSTMPLKLVNGPSLIRTWSPFSNVSFGFGFSAASVT